MTERNRILPMLGAIGCGWLLLDGQGIVLESNAKARRYLGVDGGSAESGYSLEDPGHDVNRAVQLALREALRAAVEVLPQLSETLAVARLPLRPLLLRRIRLPGDGPEGAAVAVIVLDPEDHPQPEESVLREVFLLTPAETRLARELATGESLEEIAATLGVSLGTLRVQLKMLFIKTGTSRQGELIALLANLTRLNSG